MALRLSLLPYAVALVIGLSGCETTGVTFSPSVNNGSTAATLATGISSPLPGQNFPAGKDIPITATAFDVSGVSQVIIMINGKQLAKDSKPPYTANLSKPVPGQYAIQSYAFNQYGDTLLSPPVVITVK